MKKTARYYQRDAATELVRSMQKGQIPYANLCTGSGKSLVAAMLTNWQLKQGGRVLQLVPTKELCEQNYREAFEYVDSPSDLGICCSGLNKFDMVKKAIVATNGSFINRRAVSGSFSLCIIDECFIGETLISTPNGLKRIDKVSPGDVVYNSTGTGVVKAVSKKLTDIIYKVRLSNGKEIKTTNNHPIFTQYGWVRAENLDKRHVVFGLQDLRKLRKQDYAKQKKKYSNNKKRETGYFKRMGAINRQLQRNKVLLNKLLEAERAQQQNTWSHRKNERYIKENWTQATNSRRKRERINRASKINAFYSWRRMDSRTCNTDKNIEIIKAISDMLQSGYREQEINVSHRTKWCVPSWKKENFRRKERQFSSLTRVESVSIEKQGSHTIMYNLQISGHPSYFAGGILVHNCHLVTPDPDSTYRKIIRSLKRINPDMMICGMTATPYRMDQGRLEDVCFKGEPLFTNCVYESDIPRLISEGYLSHVESISGDIEIDTSDLKMSGADYNTEQMGVKFDAIVSDAVADMRAKFETYGIQTALIFASTIANAKHILQEWGDDSTMRIVHGDMSHAERASAIKWIKQGDGKRYIVNVGILTTGFDFQALDCVALMRATASLSLYIQMCGRVIRAFIDKLKGYVLDYGTNIERMGPIDATLPPKKKKRRGDAPKKVCLLCNTVNILSAKFCKDCGGQFISESEDGKYSMRSKAEILAAKSVESYHEISEVLPMLCYSRDGNYAGTPMVKLKFYEGFRLVHEEYLMLDHPGGIANKSKVNFRSMFKNENDFYRLGEDGHTVENALIILENHQEYLKTVKSIVTVKTEGDKYKRLARVDYDD